MIFRKKLKIYVICKNIFEGMGMTEWVLINIQQWILERGNYWTEINDVQ